MNNNSLLNEAHKSAKQTFITIIQSTFYQISTIILQSYIQQKIKKNNNYCQPKSHQQQQQQYQITQNDIDVVYNIIHRIGLRWMKQLQLRNEYDLNHYVKIVLNYGHFLEYDSDDCDDNDNIEYVGNENINDIMIQDEEDVVIIGDEEKEEEKNEDETKDDKNIDDISFTHPSKNNIPFVSLLQMATKTKTNTNSHEQTNTNNNNNNNNNTKMATRHGSNQWHPLPTLATNPNNSNKNNHNNDNDSLEYNGMNHIPKCVNLPSNQLLKPSTNNIVSQLYSTPFLSLKQHCHVVKCYHPSSSSSVISTTQQHNNYNDDNDDNGKSIGTSASKCYNHEDIQRYIQIIDEMGWKNHTMFYYDWNTIHYASIRNNIRMHVQHHQQQSDGLHGSSITTIHGNISRSSSKKRDRNNNDNSIVLVDSNGSKKDTDIRLETEGARVASDLGSAQWTWDDIHTTFNSSDIDALYQEMMHDDYIINKNKNNDKSNSDNHHNVHESKNSSNEEQNSPLSQQYCHSCIGSLKLVGNIHLWEQLKQDNNWNGPKDDIDDENVEMDKDDDENEYSRQTQKRRKHAYSKAKRQRLYPNVELKRVDNLSKLTSKVTFTENSNNNFFMELDLGECMLSLSNDKNEMRHFSFRSLEIQLKDE